MLKNASSLGLIDELLAKKVRVIDYELIKKEKRRCLGMGKVAGQAAAVTLLSGLGTYLLKQRKGSPFLNVKHCFRYTSIEEAKQAVKGCVSQEKMIIALTGNG